MSSCGVCKLCNVITVDSSQYIHEHEQSAQHRWVVAIRSIIGGQTQADLFRNLQFEQLKNETIPPELFQNLLIGQECITPVDDPNLVSGASTNSIKWNCLLCGIVPPLSTIQMVDHLESKDHYIYYMMTFHPKIYEKLKDMVKGNLKVSQDGCIRLAGKDKKSLYEMYLQQEYQKLGPANLQNSALYWSDKMPRKCIGHVDVVKDIFDKYKEKLENGYIPLENGILTTNPTSYNFQSRLGDAMGQQMELFQMAQSQSLDEKQKLSVTESSKLQATIIEMLQHFLLGTPHSFMDKVEADVKIKDQQAQFALQRREEELPTNPPEGQKYVNGICKTIEPNADALIAKAQAEAQVNHNPVAPTTAAKPSLLQKYLKSEVLKYMNKNKSVVATTCNASQNNGLPPNVVTAPSVESQSQTTTNAYGSVVTTKIDSQPPPPQKGQRGFVNKRRRRGESSSSSASSTESDDRSSSGSSSRSGSSSYSRASYKTRKRRSSRYSPAVPEHHQLTARGRNDPYNGGGPTPLMNWVDPNPQAALLSMMVMGAAAASSNMMMLNSNNASQQRSRIPLPSSSNFSNHLPRGGGRAARCRDIEGDLDPTRFVYSDETECFVEITDFDYCFMDTRFNVTHQQFNYYDDNHNHYYAGDNQAFWNNTNNNGRFSEAEWSSHEKQPSRADDDQDKYDPFAQQDAGADGSDQD